MPPLSGKALLNPLFISSKQVVDPKRNYGGMPIIVLTSIKAPELPPEPLILIASGPSSPLSM